MEDSIAEGYKPRSLLAVMTDAFNTGYKNKETEYTKIQKEGAAEKKAKAEQEKKGELETAILEGKFKEEKKAKLKALKKKLSEKELEELEETFREETQGNEVLAKAYNSKGFHHPVIQSRRNKFLVRQFLPKEYHDFENYRRLHSKQAGSAT